MSKLNSKLGRPLGLTAAAQVVVLVAGVASAVVDLHDGEVFYAFATFALCSMAACGIGMVAAEIEERS